MFLKTFFKTFAPHTDSGSSLDDPFDDVVGDLNDVMTDAGMGDDDGGAAPHHAVAEPEPRETADDLADELAAAMEGDDDAPAAEAPEAQGKEPVAAEGQEQPAATKEGDKPAEPSFTPPEHYSAAQKEQFGKLPEEAQAFVDKREREVQDAWRSRMTTVNQQVRRAEQIEQIVKPYEAMMAEHNLAPETAIQNALASAAFAQNDPAGYFRWMSETMGVDLADIANGGDGKGGMNEDDFADPKVQQLQQELAELRNWREQQEQTVQQSTQQQNLQMLEDLESEKNPTTGELVRPFFSDVDISGEIVNQIRAANHAGRPLRSKQDLAALYDQVVWATPRTRNILLAQQAQQKAAGQSPAKAPSGRTPRDRARAATTVPSQNQPAPRDAPVIHDRQSIENMMFEDYDKMIGGDAI